MTALGLALLGCAVLLWPRGRRAVPGLGTTPAQAARTGGAGRAGPARPTAAGGGVARWLPRPARRDRGAGPESATALDSLAAALAAGLPTGPAVVLVHTESGRSDPDWAELAEAAARGDPLAPVWRRLARARGLPDLAVVAAAWEISERLGAPLADAVATAARGLRARAASDAALRAGTAGARASATLLTALPAVGVGMALLLGIPPTTLYGAPVPLAGLVLAVVLVLVGRRWTRAQLAAVPRRAAR